MTKLTKVELIALNACANEVAGLRELLEKAKAQTAEIMQEMGLDPDKTYDISATGEVKELLLS